VLAAVKGDAYGHGAVTCAQALARAGVDAFGVALVEEGRALRRAGIEQPILCMGGAGPNGATEAIAHKLTPLVSDLAEAEALDQAAHTAESLASIHINVDTGMGRLGVPPHHFAHFLDRLADLANLKVEGIASHLAQSDGEAGVVSTEEQIRRFSEAVSLAEDRGFDPPIKHLANSGAILNHRAAIFNMVRPGLLLYGYDPGSAVPAIPVRPVMRLSTRVLVVRDLPAGAGVSYGGQFVTDRPCRIATLPVGYADGYPRALSNTADVLIHGHRAPIRGRVCMDMCMVDVTDVPTRVRAGDEVVLLGQQGADKIDAWDLARWAGTIPYAILTGISERIPRLS
jgi:alanine racemase